MAEIKAIETVYNGWKFRSRLEAKWAIFFDEMCIPYEYEREGYDLGTFGWYLPDFWLPRWSCHIEIKPKNHTAYEDKCDALAIMSGNPVLLIHGNPWWSKNAGDWDHFITAYPSSEYDPAMRWTFAYSANGRIAGLQAWSSTMRFRKPTWVKAEWGDTEVIMFDSCIMTGGRGEERAVRSQHKGATGSF